jgi:hypothetical protein
MHESHDLLSLLEFFTLGMLVEGTGSRARSRAG